MSTEERIGPFLVHSQKGVPILESPENLISERDPADEARLLALIDANDRVVCDVSQSIEIVMPWLKFLCRLSERAKASGKKFILVGIRDAVYECADYIGIAESFDREENLNEVLS